MSITKATGLMKKFINILNIRCSVLVLPAIRLPAVRLPAVRLPIPGPRKIEIILAATKYRN